MKRDEEYKTRLASGVVNAELKVYKALIAAGKITAEDAVQVSGYPKEMFASKQPLSAPFSYPPRKF